MAQARYMPYVLDHTKIDATLVDFPVLIHKQHANLRHTSYGGNVTSLSGYDIAPFAAADPVDGLSSPIAFKLISYDPLLGKVTMRAKVASYDSVADTTIYLGYADAGITTDQSSTAAWNSAYKLALPMTSVWREPARLQSTPVIDRTSETWHISQVYDQQVFVNPLDADEMVMLFSGMAAPTQGGEQAIGRATCPVEDYPLGPWTEDAAPVLEKGTGGDWDAPAEGVRVSSIVIVGTTIWMYYTGGDHNVHLGIGLAKSTDGGATFTKFGQVLAYNQANSGSEVHNNQPVVYREDASTWHMLYVYSAGGSPNAGRRYASSSDGETWTKDGAGDVISAGVVGDDDHYSLEHGHLIKIASTFYLCNEASYDVQTGNICKFRNHLYRSSAMDTGWERAPIGAIMDASRVASTFDEKQIATPFLIEDPNTGDWHLWYSGTDTDDQDLSNWSIGVASLGNLTPADAFTAADFDDATANGNDFTPTNGKVAPYGGRNGNGFSGNGTDRELHRAALVIPTTGTLSVEVTFKAGPAAIDSDPCPPQGIIEAYDDAGGGVKLFVVELGAENSYLYAGWYNSAAGTPDKRVQAFAGGSIVKDEKYVLDVTWENGGNTTFRINGTTFSSPTASLGSTWDTSGITTYIAKRARVPDFQLVNVANLLLSNVARSVEWSDAEVAQSLTPDDMGAFGDEVEIEPASAPDFTYATPQSWVVGVAITPVVPTNAGGAATSTTVTTGALPGGVSVAADGTVSGTPLAAGSGSAKMTGANAVGTGPESNAMSWTVAAAPPEVTYDENPDTPGAADIRDTVDYAPVSVGGPFTSAAYLSGDDPADFGLTIDDETGHITGELNAIGTVSFVVRFTGPGGTVDAPFELDVSDIAPVITYTPQFYFNVPNNKLPGTGTGGTIPATGAYTKVSGDYPTGISNINADTGALAGTPTVLGETGTLVLRATNAIGDGDFTLNWVVTPPEDEDGDFGEDEAWDQMTSDGTKSIGSSAAVIVAARPGRTRLVVQNRHATQDLFLGPTGAVSSTAFAWKLTAGQSRDLGAYTGALYGYGSGAATTCTALEGYTAR